MIKDPEDTGPLVVFPVGQTPVWKRGENEIDAIRRVINGVKDPEQKAALEGAFENEDYDAVYDLFQVYKVFPEE